MADIKLFNDQRIRSYFDEGNDEWFFVITDIIAVLTASKDPSNYLKRMRQRDEGLASVWSDITSLHPIETDGGVQRMNCVNVKGAFRLIQSIPSKNVEPFKQWLAQVGQERLEEIADPELAVERAKEMYRAKGYSEEWIDARMRSIEVRKELTDQWKNTGVKQGLEYAILTKEISKATFGLAPAEYKKLKNLKKENLRDHMSNLELIFTMLGEASTKEISEEADAKGFNENKAAAIQGGSIAGEARKKLEQTTGKSIVSSDNYLDGGDKTKKIDNE